jgi:hypothetical protein
VKSMYRQTLVSGSGSVKVSWCSNTPERYISSSLHPHERVDEYAFTTGEGDVSRKARKGGWTKSEFGRWLGRFRRPYHLSPKWWVRLRGFEPGFRGAAFQRASSNKRDLRGGC